MGQILSVRFGRARRLSLWIVDELPTRAYPSPVSWPGRSRSSSMRSLTHAAFIMRRLVCIASGAVCSRISLRTPRCRRAAGESFGASVVGIPNIDANEIRYTAVGGPNTCTLGSFTDRGFLSSGDTRAQFGALNGTSLYWYFGTWIADIGDCKAEGMGDLCFHCIPHFDARSPGLRRFMMM